jgi:hypothetical protein
MEFINLIKTDWDKVSRFFRILTYLGLVIIFGIWLMDKWLTWNISWSFVNKSSLIYIGAGFILTTFIWEILISLIILPVVRLINIRSAKSKYPRGNIGTKMELRLYDVHIGNNYDGRVYLVDTKKRSIHWVVNNKTVDDLGWRSLWSQTTEKDFTDKYPFPDYSSGADILTRR